MKMPKGFTERDLWLETLTILVHGEKKKRIRELLDLNTNPKPEHFMIIPNKEDERR